MSSGGFDIETETQRQLLFVSVHDCLTNTIQPATFEPCFHLCLLVPVFVLQQVEQLYASALEAFPSSARLHWFVSQFVRYYKVNRHVEQLHLVAAEVRGLHPFFNLMQAM